MRSSTKKFSLAAGIAGALFLTAMSNNSAAAPKEDHAPATSVIQAWVGARIIDGTGKPAIEDATLIIRDGRIEAVGKRVKVPAGAATDRCEGKNDYPRLDLCAWPRQRCSAIRGLSARWHYYHSEPRR